MFYCNISFRAIYRYAWSLNSFLCITGTNIQGSGSPSGFSSGDGSGSGSGSGEGCSEGSLRPVNFTFSLTEDGREVTLMSGLEICLGGVYGGICDDDTWDDRDARVACNQFGYTGGEWNLHVVG